MSKNRNRKNSGQAPHSIEQQHSKIAAQIARLMPVYEYFQHCAKIFNEIEKLAGRDSIELHDVKDLSSNSFEDAAVVMSAMPLEFGEYMVMPEGFMILDEDLRELSVRSYGGKPQRLGNQLDENLASVAYRTVGNQINSILVPPQFLEIFYNFILYPRELEKIADPWRKYGVRIGQRPLWLELWRAAIEDREPSFKPKCFM